MENEFIMKEFPMSDKDIRELSCKQHESILRAVPEAQKVVALCKHCGKQMKEYDDPELFNMVFQQELRGDYKL